MSTATNGHRAAEDLSATVEPFDILSLHALEGFAFPVVDYVVDGLFPAGALSLVVGRPKAGKSLLMVDLLASVALGEAFLERATTQGPAIYVPAEDALRLVRDRLWVRLGPERDVPLYVVPADGSVDQSIRLDDPASFARLAATIALYQPRIVVLDPLRELHRQRENESDDMAAVLRPLRQLAHDTETHIAMIHHRNKHATDASLASRGSSAIAGGVDLVITLELSDESSDASLTPDQTMTLRVEGRYGPRQRLGARLGTGLRWRSVDPRMADDLSVRDRLIRHLEATGEELSADDLADVLGTPKKTVQSTLGPLVRERRVARCGAGTKGDAYRYRTSGRTRDESFRDLTRKTDDSSRPADTYVAVGRNHSTSDQAASCRHCGAPLFFPDTIANRLCRTCSLEGVEREER